MNNIPFINMAVANCSSRIEWGRAWVRPRPRRLHHVTA